MIILKTSDEIAFIASASRIVADAQQVLVKEVRPGITTGHLDLLAEEYIRSQGGVPAFKGYRNYPKTLCASVNEQVVHGIPSNRVLKDGDIIGLDLGAIVEGFYGDGAVTIPVGSVTPEVGKLIDVTREALLKGIEKAVVGNRLSDISHAIQTHVEQDGYSIVRDFVGHRDWTPVARGTPSPKLREAGTGSTLTGGNGFSHRADGEYG